MSRYLNFSDEWEHGSLREGSKVVVRKPYLHILPSPSDTSGLYERLVEKQGKLIKDEERTHIRLWETPEEDYFFKHYLYPVLPRVRTIGSMPKAKREYLTLAYLEHQNIPCIKAAGWGSRWDRLGGVRSCFIITARENDTIDLSTWLARSSHEPDFKESAAAILGRLGGYFRQLHSDRFFLLRPMTRNMLVKGKDPCDPEILFLDQPYARFMSGPMANWGQCKDLTTLLGDFFRLIDQSAIDFFFGQYLPDPLGRNHEDLRRLLTYLIMNRDKPRAERGLRSRLAGHSISLFPFLLDKKKLGRWRTDHG
jgi:hypothetical protein